MSHEPIVMMPEDQPTLAKKAVVQSWSPEQEVQSLAANGEWELMLKSDVFLQRSVESRVQLFHKAVNQRIQLVRQSLPLMINRGEKQRAAAMGILTQIHKLEQMRDDVIENFYTGSRDPLQIAEEAGFKMDWY
jgi:hypothetical protein